MSTRSIHPACLQKYKKSLGCTRLEFEALREMWALLLRLQELAQEILSKRQEMARHELHVKCLRLFANRQEEGDEEPVNVATKSSTNYHI